ncbi:hypothetical protein EYR97_06580 [Alteromonas sp. KUL42]|uniref:hypothetical protein n=1 Tax=Alteromonas sp. KUL42 TaxID=2480797 RepID=UPI00103692BF|nr:hypothetical protein [Alteromonas sp. KUL42]TAP37149.1 hypothetical protein EYR97_06580 [Alteromonas sp. KUL42]
MAVALSTVFNESSDFIVIGLTGRTGSGCSTSAKIMAGDNLPLPSPEDSHFEGNERRKYKIIKNFIDVKWRKFEWLQVKSVISRFLLELNHPQFCSLVAETLGLELSDVVEKLTPFKKEYDEFHQEIKEFLSKKEEDKKKEAFTIYFKRLPIFSDNLKQSLKTISMSAYTSLYQKVGDNIRASGKANKSTFDPSKVFTFPSVINKVIKAAKYSSRQENRPCYIVIDAIRNPYEAIFLKGRHSDFYLISINTNNENRLKHLRESHKFSEQQIIELDEKEYPKKLIGHNKYISQNIQKCIEISDVHINNPKDDNYGNSELASQLAWYIALMMHPGLVMPTSIENCMQIAYSAKKSSGCISRQVGAVVTNEFFSVKSVGWNNTAEGQVPCILRSAQNLLNGIDKDAYSKYERNSKEFRETIEYKYTDIIETAKKDGRNLSYCFKDVQNELEGEKNQVHTRSLHAEENAFLQLSKYGGQQLKGGYLFTTASPCELCAKKAFQLGITKIFYIDPYPGIATTHILAYGKNPPQLHLFRGALGSAFHKLYQPMMPYKDELEMAYMIKKHGNNKDKKLNA